MELLLHGRLEREAVALELLLPVVHVETVGATIVVDDDGLSELGDPSRSGMHLLRALSARIAMNHDFMAEVLSRRGELGLFLSL